MNDLSVVMQSGREKLARVRAERKASEERKQQEERERLAAYWGNFRQSLKRLVPEALHDCLAMPVDNRERDWFVRVSLIAPGCVSVLLEVRVAADGEAIPNNERWIVVPGVRSYLPTIDADNDYLPGDVVVVYYEGRGQTYDPGMALFETDDFELALALAEERHAYIEQQHERIAEEEKALEPVRRALAAAAMAEASEPVYQPLEEGDRVEDILNKAALFERFVRGLVAEALEERGG